MDKTDRIRTLFSDVIRGTGLQLFAVYSSNKEEIKLKSYTFNSDRRLILTEGTVLNGIETFRKYPLTKVDAAAEIFFALNAAVRVNNINVFVYHNRLLLPTLRRLGFALFIVGSDIKDRQPDEFLINTDEVVFDLMSKYVGLSWNTRSLENPVIAGQFGSGRIGAAVRENYLWSQQEGMIICGDRGEVVEKMRWMVPKYVSIDIDSDQIFTLRHQQGPLVRHIGSIWLKVYDYLPKGLVLSLIDQSRILDTCRTSQKPSGERTVHKVIYVPDSVGLLPEYIYDARLDDEMVNIMKKNQVVATSNIDIADETFLDVKPGIPSSTIFTPIEWIMRWDSKSSLSFWIKYGECWNHGCRTCRADKKYEKDINDMGMMLVDSNPDCEIDESGFNIFNVGLRYYRGEWRNFVAILSAYKYNPVYLSPCRHGIVSGFRVLKSHSRLYRIYNDIQQFVDTKSVSVLENRHDYWRLQLLSGCMIRANFMHSDWIRNSKLHRLAIYSISNSINTMDAWKWFSQGTSNFTFNYLNPDAVFGYERGGQDRVSIEVKSGLAHVDTGSAKWVDHMVNPSRIMSYFNDQGISCASYTHTDFLSILNSLDDGSVPMGYSTVCNPRDSYANCWIFYSTLYPSTYPWPSKQNTQTWWVKIPSVLLRYYWREGAEDQRVIRGEAIRRLSIKAVPLMDDRGYWYGWIPSISRAIDVSGHAISMLIMSGYGVVDIKRYWETVLAVSNQALTQGKKDKDYKDLVTSGNLTEDATKFPYKIWHTTYDYEASLIAYILLARDRGFKIDIWTIRITVKFLSKMLKIDSMTLAKRKELDSRVLSLFNAK